MTIMTRTTAKSAKTFMENNKIEFKGYKRLYAVKDNKEGFVEVFLQANDGVAIRNFAEAPKNQQTMIGKHPEDFELWKLGNIDSETGALTDDLRKLANAADFVNTSETK